MTKPLEHFTDLELGRIAKLLDEVAHPKSAASVAVRAEIHRRMFTDGPAPRVNVVVYRQCIVCGDQCSLDNGGFTVRYGLSVDVPVFTCRACEAGLP